MNGILDHHDEKVFYDPIAHLGQGDFDTVHTYSPTNKYKLYILPQFSNLLQVSFTIRTPAHARKKRNSH